MTLDDLKSPQTVYERMTLRECAEAILAVPELAEWELYLANGFDAVDTPVRMLRFEVGHVSVYYALDKLAYRFSANLRIDHNRKRIIFSANPHLSRIPAEKYDTWPYT